MPSQLAPQIPQLGICVHAQRIPQVNVDSFFLEPFREFHDAVPICFAKKEAHKSLEKDACENANDPSVCKRYVCMHVCFVYVSMPCMEERKLIKNMLDFVFLVAESECSWY